MASRNQQNERQNHPSAERLVDYYYDELTAEEDKVVSHHLASCLTTAEDTLAIDRYERIEARNAELEASDKEMELEFEQLLSKLPAESKTNVTQLHRRYVWAMAASLVLGVIIGLVADRAGSGLTAPVANVGVIDLFPVAEAVDRDPISEAAALSQSSLVLILNLADTRAFPQYEAVISDWSQDQALWSTRELERRATGNFTLVLPESFFPPGRYRVTLYGIENGSRFELTTYSTRFK